MQPSDDDGLHQILNTGWDEKWSSSGCALKSEAIGLDMGYERNLKIPSFFGFILIYFY